MDIFILPVSGGGFVSQIAGIQCLCDNGYKPDAVLSSSGGNVAAYIALASGFDSHRMRMIASTLSCENYIGKPNLFSIGSNIVSKSSIFQVPDPSFMFDDYFPNRETVTRTEIWTGITNISTYRPRIICNRSYENSVLRFEPTAHMDVTYQGGDIFQLKKVFVSSASIPMLVNSTNIDGCEYMDGGLSSASPLSLVYRQIGRRESFNLIYITGTDIYRPKSHNTNGLIARATSSGGSMVYNSIIRDRDTAISLLGKCEERVLDPSNWWEEYELYRSRYNRTVLELCTSSEDINMLKFKESEVLRKLEMCKSEISYKLYTPC